MKAQLRQRLRTVLREFDQGAVQQRSADAVERLLGLKQYAGSEVLMTFLSLPSEVETAQIVLQAWQDGKRVLAPRLSWEQRRILPVEIRSLDAMTTNRMGVREPADGPPIPVSYIDLVIVPGLGFDSAGNRIGRGSGFYDRFLGQSDFHGVSCGLAFQEQIVDEIPTGPHDQPVDLLVTDQRVYKFTKRSRSRRRK
jgi:5-formyltetrahydrofolate cyclo-ligase